MVVFCLSIVIALSVSFLCSIMEAALLSLTPSKLAVISERYPLAGKICKKFKENIEKPIAVILILNTAAHTFGASIAGAEFDRFFGGKYIWLFSLAFTILMVQYTEILPKTLGVRFNSRIARYMASPLKVCVRLMCPLITLVHWVNRPFDPPAPAGEDHVNLNEFSALATMARESSQISTTQEQIIRNTPTLGTRTIEEVMLPLAQVNMISEKASLEEVMNAMRTNPHSRYPVTSDAGEIVGCIHAKDFLFQKSGSWHALIRPVAWIETDMSQLTLIENVIHLDSKLLMVKNARQQAIGMLTINDALWELLGKTPARV